MIEKIIRILQKLHCRVMGHDPIRIIERAIFKETVGTSIMFTEITSTTKCNVCGVVLEINGRAL